MTAAEKHTTGPWFVSGVRFKMNGGEWHSVNRYDEAKKQDENIACVGYDPRTGLGLADARLIAAAPDLFDGCNAIIGLIQLVCSRDDMPAEIREALETSHRLEEARAAVSRAALSYPEDRWTEEQHAAAIARLVRP